jgi:hypothetical protein
LPRSRSGRQHSQGQADHDGPSGHRGEFACPSHELSLRIAHVLFSFCRRRIVAPGEHLFSLEVWSRRNGSAPRAHKLPLSGFLEKAASLRRRENCATRSVAPI